MKIKMIGTGGIWTKFNSACYLIDEDIMVDFPNGACKYLYRFDKKPFEINSVLLTHFHGDHYFDIPFYVLNKSKSSNKKANIYCSKEGKSKIISISKLAFPNSYENFFEETNTVFNFNNNFKINNYDVIRILVDHGRMKPAYGYIFKFDKLCVGFTGDTALCEGVKYMASKCSYLFCDVSFINGTSKHMGINDIVRLCEEFKTCKFVTSHMLDEARMDLKKLNIENLIVGEDGMEFNL